MTIDFTGGLFGGLRLPALSLDEGSATEVLGPDDLGLDELVEVLGARSGPRGRLVTADRLARRRVTLWDALFRGGLAGRLGALVRSAYPEVEDTREVCRLAGSHVDAPFWTASAAHRLLIDLEASSRVADFVLVSDGGLDPTGQDWLRAHAEGLVGRRPVGVLVVRAESGFEGPWWVEGPVPRIERLG
ncbi:MAG: hypothetical protein AAF211_10685 [Myxococcota bacterium]